MEEREMRLMKGNEAIAEAAIRAGADAFYGYPITPQTEVMEYLMETDATARTGMAVLQAESEVSAYGCFRGIRNIFRKRCMGFIQQEGRKRGCNTFVSFAYSNKNMPSNIITTVVITQLNFRERINVAPSA